MQACKPYEVDGGVDEDLFGGEKVVVRRVTRRSLAVLHTAVWAFFRNSLGHDADLSINVWSSLMTLASCCNMPFKFPRLNDHYSLSLLVLPAEFTWFLGVLDHVRVSFSCLSQSV